MFTILRRVIFATLIAIAATGPVAADQSALSDAQRSQVEEIIRNYLLENPELLVEIMERLEEKRKTAAQERSREQITARKDEIFDAETDYVVNPEGEIPIVEFFDYQCSYCKRIYPTVQRVLQEQKNVRFIFKEFPILGEASVIASRAALAARKQGKYMEFHNAVMNLRTGLNRGVIMTAAREVGLDMDRLQEDMASPEIEDIIQKNRNLADALEIRGTPTMIIGETLVPGAIGYERIVELVREARSGCRVC